MNDADDFPYERALRTGIAGIVTQALGWPDAETHIGELFSRITAYLDDLLATLGRDQPSPRTLACREGCAFCCHWYEVHVTPLEILVIAEHVGATFAPEERTRLIARIAATEDEKRRHPPEGDCPVFACPLLVDGSCSVYAVRPMTCRGFNSFDAAVCEETIVVHPVSREAAPGRIEGYAHPQKVAINALQGIRAALGDTGLGSDVLDLTPALGIALRETDAARRWLAGEPVFEGALSRLAEARGERARD